MRGTGDKAYYLKPEELACLLGLFDVNGLRVFETVNNCRMDNITAAKAMLSLAGKQVLITGDKQYSLQDDWKTIMDCLGSTVYSVVESGNGLIPERILFAYGDRRVVFEMDERSGNWVRVSISDANALLDQALQSGVLPVQDSAVFGTETVPDNLSPEALEERGSLLWLLERYQRGAEKADWSVCVCRDSLCDRILVWKGTAAVLNEAYSVECFSLLYQSIGTEKAFGDIIRSRR